MNYVLIYPDELRAESLACYGHPLVKTPNIDRLAQEGVLFERNYTQHPVCGPSRACLATGWYPHVDARRSFYLLDSKVPNMFSLLKKSGFHLGHAGKDDMFDRASMPLIFDDLMPFRLSDANPNQRTPVKEIGLSTMLTAPIDPNILEQDQRFTNDVKGYLQRRRDDGRPFFLMLSLFNPHPPYTALEEYYNMYDPDDLPPLRGEGWLDGKPDLYHQIRRFRRTKENDPALYRKVQAVYLGMVSYVDNMVGQVIQSLQEHGLYKNTMIIFCSDHGDFAGEVGLVEKWPNAMDDMITRVPLIVRRPGCPEGLRVHTLTQSMDILPTICDYENVAIDYDQFGISLRPQVEGSPGDEQRAVYCEGGYDRREPHCFEPTCFVSGRRSAEGLMENQKNSVYYPKMLQQQEKPDSVCRTVMQCWQEWKITIRTNDDNELYNLQEDPLEQHNLFFDPRYEQIRNELVAKSFKWLINTSDVTPWERHW